MDTLNDIRADTPRHETVLYPVILCGGSGTRLWPMSRQSCPKQFLPLVSDNTMLQETAIRTAADGFAAPVVVCSAAHRSQVADQLHQIGIDPSLVLLEPEGRNTAPAIAVAAMALHRTDPEAVMLVQPSDHFLRDRDGFMTAVDKAAAAARRGFMTTFGIVPTHPETGFGYIRTGRPLQGIAGAFTIGAFVEKPPRNDARTFVDSGEWYWNSGMFVLSAERYLGELRRLHPAIHDCCTRALDGGGTDGPVVRLHPDAFAECPNISIDHAVMEPTEHAAVVPMDVGWSDIGSWNALYLNRDRDEDGNVLEGDVIARDTLNTYIRADDRLVAAIGVEELVIVSTEDAVLVSAADRSDDVREVVAQLNRANRPEPVSHRKVERPWGYYQTIDQGERFQVKRIVVNPGASLSLQMHYHRAEHWTVVQGSAAVTLDDRTTLLSENESSYIAVGVKHRLENPGKVPLHLIEVQCGGYLGEDDIVRFDDIYGRV